MNTLNLREIEKQKKHIKLIKKISFILICVITIISLIEVQKIIVFAKEVQADNGTGIAIISWDFDEDSENRFIIYNQNYSIDMEKADFLDGGWSVLNSITNAIFGIIRMISYLTCSIYYFSSQISLIAEFSEKIDLMQSNLVAGIFDTLFLLAFAFSAWALIKKMASRNVAGMFSDIAKIILIFALSVFISLNSSTVLTLATDINDEVSNVAFTTLSGDGEQSSSDMEVCGILWRTLVHEPWLSIQFGNSEPTEDEVELILQTPANSDAHANIIKEYSNNHKDTDPFLKENSGGKLAFVLVYIIPALAKAIIFMAMSVLRLGFQLISIFYIFLAPIVLLMALVPAMGGMNVINSWLKKMAETQLSNFFVKMIVAIILAVDFVLWDMVPSYGWFIVLVIEIIVILVVVIKYKELIGLAGTLSKDPTQAGNALRSGSAFNNFKMQKARQRNMTSNRGESEGKEISFEYSNKQRSNSNIQKTRQTGERLQTIQNTQKRQTADSIDFSQQREAHTTQVPGAGVQQHLDTGIRAGAYTDISGGGSMGGQSFKINEVARPTTTMKAEHYSASINTNEQYNKQQWRENQQKNKNIKVKIAIRPRLPIKRYN